MSLTYHERIDGCPDLTPDEWRRLHGPLPGERQQGMTRQQVVERHRCAFLIANGGGVALATTSFPGRAKHAGGRPRKPVVSDRGERFPSADVAARAFDYSPTAVAVAIGRRGVCAGRTWRYLTREELSDAQQDTKLSA